MGGSGTALSQHLPLKPKYQMIETAGRNCIEHMRSLALLLVGSVLIKKKCNGDGLPYAIEAQNWTL